VSRGRSYKRLHDKELARKVPLLGGTTLHRGREGFGKKRIRLNGGRAEVEPAAEFGEKRKEYRGFASMGIWENLASIKRKVHFTSERSG